MSWAKYRVWCDDEAKFVYAWSPTVIDACPNDAEHDIDLNTLSKIEDGPNAGTNRLYSVPAPNYVESTNYATLFSFVYDGSEVDGWPVEAKFRYKTANASGDNASIRIQDTTNGQTVCEITGLNGTDWAETVADEIDNLAAEGPVTWEIQAKTESGASVWVEWVDLLW